MQQAESSKTVLEPILTLSITFNILLIIAPPDNINESMNEVGDDASGWETHFRNETILLQN